MTPKPVKDNVDPQDPASATIVVHRQWNDWRQAVVPLSQLSDPHWSDTSGGVRTKTPRLFIHGYLSCDQIISDELAHSCEHGPPPHNIKVCVVKKDNEPKIFAHVKEIARF